MWIVCWRLGDTVGKGHPGDRATAVSWAKDGNKRWGAGTHWVVQIIEGGAKPLKQQQPKNDEDGCSESH